MTGQHPELNKGNRFERNSPSSVTSAEFPFIVVKRMQYLRARNQAKDALSIIDEWRVLSE